MSNQTVVQKVLPNGLNILVVPQGNSGKIACQMWYGVGSKDEKSGQKGLAHLLEHMIFKGTATLTESDINAITHKLSGYCNAFTSYDYTGYLFDLPKQNWEHALSLFADCMQNCTFKTDMLNSELQAVVQELKLYKDDYQSTLLEEMVSAIFADHPYHHPIIGYKQDLWDVTHDSLMKFYKQHYAPNNATLVVVGDVKPDDVFAKAQKEFGNIAKKEGYEHSEYYHNKDISAKAITLHRDVQQPMQLFAFTIPGFKQEQSYYLDTLAWIIGSGRGSLLYKKLVDELQLATDVVAFVYELFDHGLFFIEVEPNEVAQIPKIKAILVEIIEEIHANGFTNEQIERAQKQVAMGHMRTFEDNEKLAYAIGESFLATGNPGYVFNYLDFAQKDLSTKLHELVKSFLRPTVMHSGLVLPLPVEDLQSWGLLQEQSDKEDARIVAHRPRTSNVEPAAHVHNILEKPALPVPTIEPQTFTLPNGLKVVTHDMPQPDKIELMLHLKANAVHDPQDKEGLMVMLCAVMEEGTKNYPGLEFANEIEKQGISFDVGPGKIIVSALTKDLPVALDLLFELLHNATLTQKAIDKIRVQCLNSIKQFWDTPAEFSKHLVQKELYKGHPYSRLAIGTADSIARITQKDLQKCYSELLTPQESVLALVGNIKDIDVEQLVTQKLGNWAGPKLPDIKVLPLQPAQQKELVHPINRDQVVLCFARPSVERLHPLYDLLSLYDQMFSGGVLGSMSSKLFQLREQTGLFYTIGGSVVLGADEQPGMLFVKTIVSLDRLEQAEKLITESILSSVQTITQEELQEAANAIVNATQDLFASQQKIAQVLLFLERFKLPGDYFAKRSVYLQQATVAMVQEAVTQLLGNKELLTLKVGRL